MYRAQVPLVRTSGARVEVVGAAEELVDPGRQLRRPQCWVDPLAALHVGTHAIQVALGLRLGGEGPTRLRRPFREWAGEEGRGKEVFPLHRRRWAGQAPEEGLS